MLESQDMVGLAMFGFGSCRVEEKQFNKRVVSGLSFYKIGQKLLILAQLNYK